MVIAVVSGGSVPRQQTHSTARQIHFPGDMSRWRDGREWPCLGPGPGLGRVVENAGRYLTYKPWESSSQNSAENLKKYLKLKRFTMENNEEQELQTPLPLVDGCWCVAKARGR